MSVTLNNATNGNNARAEDGIMTHFAVGIDIAADDFTCSCVAKDLTPRWIGKTFPQNDTGWTALLDLLTSHHIALSEVALVMEATGVYSEKISHFLYQHGGRVYVEPPRKVKAACYERGKNDPVDSRQIAEYAFRFADRLHLWQPRHEIVETLAVLLTTREQFVKTCTGWKNMLKAFQRKQVDMTDVIALYAELIDTVQHRIDLLEQEMDRQITRNPALQHTTTHLLSIPYVGRLLITHLLIVTNGYTQQVIPTKLASYAGICPFEHQSGTSVYRPPTSDGAGPAMLRKHLYLAALRLRRNHPGYQAYFERKVAEGKSPRLVINNIENRLLRLICGVIKSGKPYMEQYHSLKPA